MACPKGFSLDPSSRMGALDVMPLLQAK